MGRALSLDALDRRIIERLQVDGRTPYDAIAAHLGVTPEEVERRTDRLVADQVISIVAVTDPLQLGYPRQAMLGVRVDGPCTGAEAGVTSALVAMEEVIYLACTEGDFDLLAEVVGTSDAHLLELVARIRRLPGVTRIHTFLYQELVKETYAYGTA